MGTLTSSRFNRLISKLWELLQVRDLTDLFLNCGNSYKFEI
ncbi:restriction endonuclease [Leptospira noguchii]|uniref:Uncharacterized protein n=1 Tax=Leptospira noguchii serovar Autumnalis str. ZUN142 TaxID=1085540 RepID=M6UDC7_9LEPT|nr:hypothetical protein LEP1GSC170_0795 [Leptospira interrogans serovar Bataviae str. HAI135]EMO40841.1 hypothetical protein LEP1GSC186_0594 [Leptospira noguchii serovar Autumnalis str. ZUN142]TQE67302.1 restriction endonuclease [Leptospira noguchii]